MRSIEKARSWLKGKWTNFCWWLAFGMFLLTGCSEEPADLYGDERFTEVEQAQIQEGADWLYTQAGLPTPRIRWGMKFEGSEPMPKTIRRENGPTANGECFAGAVYLGMNGDPRINAGPVSGPTVPGWAAHELAHCSLGFGDRYFAGQEQSEGIMRVLYPMRWTESEQKQCVAVGSKCPSGLEGTK